MRDEVKKHIDDSLAKIRVIFEAAAAVIEALPEDGKSKVPGTTLAGEVGKPFGINMASMYPTMLFLYKGYPGTELRKGAHGGIVRLARVTAPAVVVTDDAAAVVDDAECKDSE
jgi:hypothetical protein